MLILNNKLSIIFVGRETLFSIMNSIKHILILAFTVSICALHGQNIAIGPGFEASKELNENSDAIISVLIKGDIEQIKIYTQELGGKFKYAAKNIASISLPMNQLDQLIKKEGIEQIEISSGFGSMNDTSKVMSRTKAIVDGDLLSGISYSGNDVIIGFVDEGIDIDHPDFLNADGTTRILALWDQNRTAGGADEVPQPYNYGIVWDSAAINDGNCDHVESGSHGTASAGTAAGNGRGDSLYQGYGYQADIIMVSYKNSIFSDGVTDGVHFIFNYADSLNKPCVINLSVGSHYGAHDGQDLSTQAVEALLEEKNGRVVVAAAGNSGASNVHIGATLGTDTVFTYFNDWTAGWQANDAFTTMFADSNDMKQVRFAFGVDIMDAASNTYRHKGKTDFINIVDQPDRIDEGDWRIDSIFDNDSAYVARMRTKIISEQGGVYWLQAWWEVNDTYWSDSANCIASMFLTGGGKIDFYSNYQYDSYFSQNVVDVPDSNIVPAFKNYLMPDNNGSVVSLWQCSPKVITVGNYVNRVTWTDTTGAQQMENLAGRYKGGIEPSSSNGPTRTGISKPDITAPGRRTISSKNTDYNPGLSRTIGNNGYYWDATGTSIAAPVISGIVSMYLEANPSANYQQIINDIKNTAFRDAQTGASPSNIWGYGKVDAFEFLSLGINLERDTVCLGTSSSFTHSGVGVTDSSILIWDFENDGINEDTTSTLTTNHTYDSVGDYSVKCLVKTGGIEDIYTFTAHVMSMPSNVNLGNDTAICYGSTLTLEISGTYDSIFWNNTDQDSITQYADAGNIIVMLKNANNCSTTDTLVLSNIGIEGALNLGQDTSLCNGDTLSLAFDWSATSYLWNDSTTDSNHIFTQTDTLWLQAEKEGCIYRDTLMLSVDSLPIITFSDSVFCYNDSLILAGGQGSSYSWSTGSSDTVITIDSAGTYSLSLSNSYGCASQDSIEVQRIGAVPVNLGNDTAFCAGNTLFIDISIDSASYLWHLDSVQSALSFNNSDTIWAQRTVDGCITRDSLILVVHANPNIEFNDSTFCYGSYMILSPGNQDTGSLYSWSMGSNDSTITIDSAGNYSLSLSNSYGCTSQDSIEVQRIGAVPVNLGNDTLLCSGDTMVFDVNIEGASYLWYNDSVSSAISITSGDFIWVEQTDSQECITRDTVIVASSQTPTVNFNANRFCKGDSIILDIGNTNNTIAWLSGQDTSVLTINEPGLVSVTVTNQEGCSVTAAMTVEELALPNFSLGNDTTICQGASIKIGAGQAYTLYNWSGGSQDSSITVTSPDTIILSVTDSNTCQSSDTVIIHQVIDGGFSLGNDTTLCTSASITLGTDIIYASYLWANGSNDTSLMASLAGNYHLTTQDQYGCSYSDSISIDYQDTIVWNVSDTVRICPEGFQTISVNDSFEQYYWSSDSTQDSASIVINDSGKYILTANHSSGCIAKDSITVIFDSIDYALNFVSSVSAPAKAIFGNQTPNLADYTFKWYFGDGDSSSSYNPIHQYAINGNYTVTLIATNRINNCSDTLVKSEVVTINQIPGCDHNASISYNEDEITCQGDSILLSAPIYASAVYQWFKDGFAIDGKIENSFYVKTSGSYMVSIVIEGCTENSEAINISIGSIIDTPIIEADASFEACNRITLTTTNSYENYLWSDGSQSASTTTKTAGVFTVTVWNEGSCKMTSDTFIVGSGAINLTDICHASRAGDSIVAIYYDSASVSGALEKMYLLRKALNATQYQTIQIESEFDGVMFDKPGTHRLDSFSYKLSSKDTCKVRDTSDIVFRISMLKVINKGAVWEVNWNEYEGLEYSHIVLLRKTLNENDSTDFIVIDTFQRAVKTYTEPKDPIFSYAYKIQFLDAYTCNDSTPIFTNVFDTDIGIPVASNSVIKDGKLLYYPNPVGQQLTIEYFDMDILSIDIINIVGSVVERIQVGNQANGQINLDWSAYNSGIYFMQIHTSNEIEVIKIQKD